MIVATVTYPGTDSPEDTSRSAARCCGGGGGGGRRRPRGGVRVEGRSAGVGGCVEPPPPFGVGGVVRRLRADRDLPLLWVEDLQPRLCRISHPPGDPTRGVVLRRGPGTGHGAELSDPRPHMSR